MAKLVTMSEGNPDFATAQLDGYRNSESHDISIRGMYHNPAVTLVVSMCAVQRHAVIGLFLRACLDV